MYQTAMEAGAIGGKISGAGGGGFMFFYCPNNTRFEVIKAISTLDIKVTPYEFAMSGLYSYYYRLMPADAIILAGGMGTRLKSVISDIPKPMAPVANKPFLTYILNQLCSFDITEVKLSVGYKHEVVESYFGTKYKHLNLEYIVEKEPLGTGGGIRLAAEACYMRRHS